MGILTVNRSDEAIRFINWWADRLYLFCYDDIARGIFTDQKWIDLAPCFFDVEIFKHRGYDFATWSLLDCGMTEENGKFFVKGDPLRFIHFSFFLFLSRPPGHNFPRSYPYYVTPAAPYFLRGSSLSRASNSSCGKIHPRPKAPHLK